jgi:hypothetical protein
MALEMRGEKMSFHGLNQSKIISREGNPILKATFENYFEGFYSLLVLKWIRLT